MRCEVEPDEAVAAGAAVQRARLEGHLAAPLEDAGRVVQSDRGAVQPRQLRRLHVLGPPPHQRHVFGEQRAETVAVGAQRHQ
jgi:hypothetical protein